MSVRPFAPYSFAVVTPFSEGGELTENAVKGLIGHLKGQGVPAFLVSGSTGEQHSMTIEERSSLYRWAVQEAGSLPVYTGVAAVRTADAETLAKAAEKAGAAGVLLGFSPYLRLTAHDARSYVARVAAATKLPLILYNNPTRTAFDLTPETLESLVQDFPTIRGLKEGGDPARASRIKGLLGKEFQIFSGHDRTIAADWARGYDGLTSIAGNLWPQEMAAVVGALDRGRTVEASALLAALAPQIAAVIEPQVPSSLKYALRLKGLPGGWCREPLGHLGPDLEQRIEAALT